MKIERIDIKSNPKSIRVTFFPHQYIENEYMAESLMYAINNQIEYAVERHGMKIGDFNFVSWDADRKKVPYWAKAIDYSIIKNDEINEILNRD